MRLKENNIKDNFIVQELEKFLESNREKETIKLTNNWLINGSVIPAKNNERIYLTTLMNLTGSVDRNAKQINVIDEIKKGFNKASYTRMKTALAISNEELCKIIDIPVRTVSSRKHFKKDESEKIFRLGTAFQKATEIFEDITEAREWFLTPAKALGNTTPLEHCDTDIGAREVYNLLGQIEHGVFS